jgi:hypothetical protein
MTEQERARRERELQQWCQYSGDPKKCKSGLGSVRAADHSDAKLVSSLNTNTATTTTTTTNNSTTTTITTTTTMTPTGGKGVRSRQTQTNPYCQFSGDPKKCKGGQGKVATGQEKLAEAPPLPPAPKAPLPSPRAPTTVAAPIVRRALQHYCQFSGDPKKCGKGGQGTVDRGPEREPPPPPPTPPQTAPLPPPSPQRAPLAQPPATFPIVRSRRHLTLWQQDDSEIDTTACAAQQRKAHATLESSLSSLSSLMTATCREFLQRHVSDWECRPMA